MIDSSVDGLTDHLVRQRGVDFGNGREGPLSGAERHCAKREARHDQS